MAHRQGNGCPVTNVEAAGVEPFHGGLLNGTRAAMRAGYTQNPAAAQVQASRLLTKPDVRKAVAKLVKAKLDRLDFKAEEVLEVIAKRIRHDIGDMFEDDCNITGDGHIDRVLKVIRSDSPNSRWNPNSDIVAIARSTSGA